MLAGAVIEVDTGLVVGVVGVAVVDAMDGLIRVMALDVVVVVVGATEVDVVDGLLGVTVLDILADVVGAAVVA